MEGRTRFVFPVLMGGIITFFVTAIVTFVNVGIPADFLHRWMKSWSVGWPVAAFIAFISMPHVRRAAERIAALLDQIA